MTVLCFMFGCPDFSTLCLFWESKVALHKEHGRFIYAAFLGAWLKVTLEGTHTTRGTVTNSH